MSRRLLTLLLNLILGNLILWYFELGRGQDHLDIQFIIGFSVSAILFLNLAFRWLHPRMGPLKIILFSAVTSFLVPVLGLPLSFINLNSLNGTINGALIGALFGAMVWGWALPMFVLNSFLFWWVAKNSRL